MEIVVGANCERRVRQTLSAWVVGEVEQRRQGAVRRNSEDNSTTVSSSRLRCSV